MFWACSSCPSRVKQKARLSNRAGIAVVSIRPTTADTSRVRPAYSSWDSDFLQPRVKDGTQRVCCPEVWQVVEFLLHRTLDPDNSFQKFRREFPFISRAHAQLFFDGCAGDDAEAAGEEVKSQHELFVWVEVSNKAVERVEERKFFSQVLQRDARPQEQIVDAEVKLQGREEAERFERRRGVEI